MKFCLILTLVGVVLRVGVVVAMPEATTTPDSKQYHEIAVNLLSGHGFALENRFIDTPREMDVIPTARRSPLYPLFLAVVYFFFGSHTLAASYIQAVLAAGVIPLTFLLLQREMGHRAAFGGAIAVTIWPAFLVYAGRILNESMFIVIFLGLALAFSYYFERRTKVTAVIVGVLLGFLSLTKGIFVPLLFLFLAAVLILPFLRRYRLHVILMVSICVAVLAPWTARNFIQFGEFIPTQSSAGFELWWASSSEARDIYLTKEPTPPHLLSLSPEEYSRQALPLALENIQRDPLSYLQLTLRRIIDFWKIPVGFNVLHKNSSAAAWLLAASYYIVLAAAISSTRGRAPKAPFFRVFAVVLVYVTVLHAAVLPEVDNRFHLPYMPIIFGAAFSTFLSCLPRSAHYFSLDHHD